MRLESNLDTKFNCHKTNAIIPYGRQLHCRQLRYFASPQPIMQWHNWQLPAKELSDFTSKIFRQWPALAESFETSQVLHLPAIGSLRIAFVGAAV
jgi:hypothetical protein